MRFSLTLLPVLALTVSAVTPPNGSTFCSSKLPSTTYPNKCEIFQVFNHLNQGNFSAFFANVAPDVEWTLMGTHPLAGVYTNRTIFITDAILRLANTLAPGATANLLSIIGGGAEEWSVQEIHALGVCKNGLKYDNVFSWATRWSTEGIIVQVHAFFDSHLVTRAITENESPEYFYTDKRMKLEPGPVGAGCAVQS